jgi:transposase
MLLFGSQLKPKPSFSGRTTYLTDSLKGGRLRAEDIRELIKEKFKVDYGLSGIYPLLHRLGYSWITSRSIHPKADKNLQESFKK